MDEPLPRPRTSSWGRLLALLALTLVVVAAVAGLLWIGFTILLVAAMGSYGSNK